MKTGCNFISGAWQPALSGATYTTRNPADLRQEVGEYPRSGEADAQAAIAAAAGAFPGWRDLTAVARGRLLSQASNILAQRKQAVAEAITIEEGKTLAESLGEVQRAIDIFRFFGGLSYTLGGQTIPHDLPENLLYTIRQPLGVAGLITPWNFPIAIPAWKMAPALVCGNSVVIKPASSVPGPVIELARCLEEAGLPRGVLNVVIGDGRSAGGALVRHSAVQALSFTGSYDVGRQIHLDLAPRMARSQLEMGSKNPTIVLADADLDLAADLAARAGFGLTGQACTATSRVIVERAVLEPFTERLVARARSWKVGPGMEPGIQMGPAASPAQLATDLSHVEDALAEGARLLQGGRRLDQDPLQHGCFMAPTVLGGVTPAQRIAREEVFGPVIAIIAAGDFDEALAIANGVDTGLSASIVTRNLRKAMLYAERIEAGVVKINQISTGLALQAPFGGVKQSSTDTFREQGQGAIEFYSRLKTVYLDYSAPEGRS